MDPDTAARFRRFIRTHASALRGRQELFDTLPANLRGGATDGALEKAFRSYHHVTPFQYLQFCKVVEAQDHFFDPHRTLSDIAHEVGLLDAQALNRLFKRHYGEAAGRIRATMLLNLRAHNPDEK